LAFRDPNANNNNKMNNHTEKIYGLWDELGNIQVESGDAAVRHMLSGLCSLFNAQNACWAVLVRLPTKAPGDVFNGWRPRCWLFLHQPPKLVDNVNKRLDKLQGEKLPSEVDISLIMIAAGDDPFLIRHLHESLPPEWFEGEHYRRHYLDMGHADYLSARISINEDVRVIVLIYRDSITPRFTADLKEPFGLAMRGLKWFHRQQLLSHGLLIADAPLTPTERKVLLAILGGQVEKQIADSMGHSHSTTHTHVKSIYRKFGVNNRPALTALWLGKLA
jgi:DNA-binding CsgD family transcriptional regulator